MGTKHEGIFRALKTLSGLTVIATSNTFLKRYQCTHIQALRTGLSKMLVDITAPTENQLKQPYFYRITGESQGNCSQTVGNLATNLWIRIKGHSFKIT